MADQAGGTTQSEPLNNPRLVIGGAALGTLFEWYDFFLYGSLAGHIAHHFFAGVNEAAAFTFALAAFAAGFVARPFGALVFGRIGDVVGRKNTFLVTMTIMGLSTFLVGLLPGYATLGVAAPILLVTLRLLQGLAIGGEYGGAAIYVAEHAPATRRAFHTSWINAMATVGLITSLLVIIGFRTALSAETFAAWGWRGPFLVSAVLLGISLWIRVRLQESPVFRQMKAEGTLSKAPFAEAFGQWGNLKLVLIALFGVVVGGTSLWYTAHFYVLFFLQRVLKVDELQTNVLMAIALAIAAPAYVLFGWLSDRFGRKFFLIAGCAICALTAQPLFKALTWAANPGLAQAMRDAPVAVYADRDACAVQFDPLGARRFEASGCDVAKAFLSKAGVSYVNSALPTGSRAEIRIGSRIVSAPDSEGLTTEQRRSQIGAFQAEARAALTAAGYSEQADPAQVNAPLVVAIIAFLVSLAAMVYAPVAAFLVELFPARIRYTSLSFPYHLGSGWVGGLLPASAFAIVAARGDVYSGLWYVMGFCTLTTVVGVLFAPETRGRPIS